MIRSAARHFRRQAAAWLAPAAVIAAIGITLVGCARDPEAAQAEANAAIGIEPGSFAVTITNKAGMPLVDLQVGIVSAGFTPFTKLISRMENSEQRDVSLSEFSSRDGTQFNLRTVRPKSVRVTAKDLTGKSYDVEVPWR